MKFKFIVSGATKGLGGSSELVVSTDLPKLKKPRSLIVLILANLVPIIGILFFGWTLFEVLLTYWLETVVIWMYNIPKMAKVISPTGHRIKEIFQSTLFIGLFIGAEFVGLIALFGGPGETMLPGGQITNEDFKVFLRHADIIIISLITLFISHGISFYQNFLKKQEFLHTTMERQARAPVNRIVVMHIAVGLGGFLASKLGSPIPTLVLLGLLKMLFDAKAHMWEHEQAARRQKDIPSPTEMQKLLEDSENAIERKYPKGGIFPNILKLLLGATTRRLSDMSRKVPVDAPPANSSVDKEGEDTIRHL